MTALHVGLRPDEALERGAPLRRDASEFPDKISRTTTSTLDLAMSHIGG